MTNNLSQLKKDLKSFAKKCKDFKYTDSALFTFLLNGMLISAGELSAESKDSGISNQVNLINSSIGQMRKDFKHARSENNKLIKNINLELTQLMEQGDHVTKSPWSNWQIGANDFYNDWHGHFKGRGNRVQDSKFYQRDTTMEKYNYQLKNLSTYGATRLKLDSNNMENPVEIQIDASLRTLAIDKSAPTFVPTTPSGGLPPFEPLMVTPPVINPKNVNISQPPQSPTINVGVEDVPDNYTGYNKDGTMANNSLLSQLDLTGGNFNLFFHGGGQPYDYSFINASENATYIPSGSGINLPSSDNGTSPKVAFFGMGGKLLAEIPSNVTVNAVSNVSGDVNVLYYMGNNNDASNPESKLIHRGTTNLYGNDLLVVKIDNVTSNGNITFVNEGKINGYAQKGTYTDLITGIPGGTGNDPKGHIFAAFTYGDAGVDTVENGNNGVVEFYAPKSYGWVYTSATNAPLKRSSINNGIMRLFGSESIGVSGTTNDDPVVQTSWADIQLNKPIEIYGDKSVGVSFLVESDNTVSSNFSNSKFNVQIGGSALTAQDATYGDTEGDVSKVQNSIGINFDFTEADAGFTDKGVNNYIVKLEDNSKNSTAVRLGQAKLTFNDSANSGITLGGEDNIGYLSDGSANNNLIYNNTANNFKVSGKNAILFAAKDGGTLKVNNSLPLSSTAVSGKGFTLAYSEGAGSTVTLNQGVTGEVVGSDAVLYYAKNSGNVTVTEAAVAQPSTVVNSSGVTVITDSSIGTPKVTISGNNGVGFYATNGGQIVAENSFMKLSDGLVGAYSDGSTSNINLKNSILDYKGNGYSVYSGNNGKIDLQGSTVVLRGKAIGVQGSSLSDITTNANTKIVVMSNDAIPFEFKDKGIVNLTSIDTDLGIAASGIQVVNGEDGTTAYTNYKKAFIDGMLNYNINTDIDKSLATNIANETTDSFKFVKRYLVQRAVLNLQAGKNVTAHLSSSDLTATGMKGVVGLDMSSSSSAVSNNETQINLAAGSSVSADRTDAGSGAVGLFINYGKVNTDASSTINVEQLTTNPRNDSAVGIYAVNGSEVNNEGTVNVGGNSSIGLLGLAYREDATTGVPKVNEFGGKPGEGTTNIVNKGNVTLDGTTSHGIYVKNNNSAGTKAGAIGTNTGNGVLTLSGDKSIGMIGDKATLTNDTNAKINMTGQEQVGMFANNSSSLVNRGEINLAASAGSVPSVGIYTNDAATDIVNDGKINGGNKNYGIFGTTVTHGATGEITVGDKGVGIYSTEGNVTLNAGSKVRVGANEAVGVFTTGTAGRTINADTNMTIGDSSFGYVIKNTGITNLTTNGTATLGNEAKFIYSNNKDITVTNNVPLTSTGNNTYGIYSAGAVTNNADIDFGRGTGSVAIYAIDGGTARNATGKTITVSGSNLSATPVPEYGMGMATSNGTIINDGTIKVALDEGIGMFASGSGSKAINNGTIELSGKNTKGMYVDNNAVGENWGIIKTVPTANNDGILGVVATGGGVIKNYGQIIVDGPNNKAGYLGSTGTFSNETSGGTTGTVTNTNGADGVVRKVSNPTSKTVAGIEIIAPPAATAATIKINNNIVIPTVIDTNISTPNPSVATVTSPDGTVTTIDLGSTRLGSIPSNEQVGALGMYIDTSGVNYTHPIEGLNNLTGLKRINLIFGNEAARYTDSKVIEVGDNIINPYNNMILSLAASSSGMKFALNAGSLTWFATATQNLSTGALGKVYLVKIPYTAFAQDGNTYNFLGGLEQRYGVETTGREKELFNKLNDLGKGESHILAQAVDEMKGHQYANIQQRTNATGNALDNEFNYLRNEWRNPTKQNNKIKAFGLRDEYNTDTAGIFDYKSNAYGVAYVHEDEKVRMGNSSGWYAGAVTNRFRFKDLGKSREDQTMIKAGIFKTMSPKKDYNGALQWTVAGDVFAGINNMKRKFWIVDDTFEAKSTYHTYGAALKNELGYDIRMSERTHLRPFGALKMEYGRFNDVKENSGQVRLQVKGNDYFSVKPEAGVEFKYVQPLAVKTNLTVGLTAAYENEIGKLQNGNQARVRYTTADWYNLEKEKEDRRGNGKFDLNIGVDNTRFGVTVNAGYDTKGNNVRGGIGFRAIY
ncbi:MAG: autotransporter-associated N-terminal domain-containing protein [Leptotrichia wadei]|uniref:autotransporter-associated N-terminal domain-containing protein n=1 Tax=Leptotrichia wadei TaxID=157687 RepID=UPI0026EE5B6D|nr:autotransporter-associated N-terminal domain-containing protein [Leptotrichia wadei]MBS6019478.1 autotransporter-associated N-terminal domain-containing protein [Leptotrichia wadei]